MQELTDKGKLAKKASAILQKSLSSQKDRVLRIAAENLVKNTALIIKENEKDLENAKMNGLKGAIIDRLTLSRDRIEGMAEGLLELIQLEDPIGEVISMNKRPNGLMIGKKRVPIGVIGMIYEARPNVTVDVFGLCIKTGNVVILRGGKEAFNSNNILVSVLRNAISEGGLPEDAVQLVQDTTRESAVALMKLNDYLDLLIPRGGAGLIQTVVMNSTVPVIETG
ncbi:MAG: aldehyde dehydrogenase family protein, partial [Bacteroidota bacterium]